MSNIFNYIPYDNINDVDNYTTGEILIYNFKNVKFRTHVSSLWGYQTPIGIHDNKIISITNKNLSFLIHKYRHFWGYEYANELKNTYESIKNETTFEVIYDEVLQFFDYDSVNGTGHSYDLMFYLLYHYKINNMTSKLLVVKTNNIYYNACLELIKKYFNVDYVFIETNKTYLFTKFNCIRTYQNILFNEVKDFINKYLIKPIIKKYDDMNEKYYDTIIKLKYKNIHDVARGCEYYQVNYRFYNYLLKNNIYDLNNSINDEEMKIYLINKAKHIIILGASSTYYININYYLHDTNDVFITILSHPTSVDINWSFQIHDNIIKQHMPSHYCVNIMDQVYNNWSFKGEIIRDVENIDNVIERLRLNMYNYNTTIILQGEIYNEELADKTIDYYRKIAYVIVSTYYENKYDIIERLKKKYPTVIFLNNNLEEYKSFLINTDNYCTSESTIRNDHMNHYYYQIKTTETALKCVKTKYVIKSRIDCYFSDMENFIKETIKNDDVITCIDMWIRSYDFCMIHNLKYHASDVCYGGTYEIVNQNSINEIDNFCLSIGCVEDKKWRYYCNEKLTLMSLKEEDILNDKETYSNFMSKIFNIYPISKNGGMCIVKNNIYSNFAVKTSKQYFIEGV